MLEFNSLEELKNNEELKALSKQDFQKVLLQGREAIVCGTNLVYEDMLWGGIYEIIYQVNEKFDLLLDECEFASQLRDEILDMICDSYGIQFIDMCDEY